MVNLLPPSERLALTHLRLNRATSIVGIGCLAVLGLAALVLLGLKINVQHDLVVTEEALLNVYKDPAVKTVLESEQAIKNYNQQLESIAAVSGRTTSWHQLLTAIANTVPPGVTLKSMILGARDMQQLTLAGQAETREALLAFQTALAKAGLGKIESPLTNYVAEQAIAFNLNITLTP